MKKILLNNKHKENNFEIIYDPTGAYILVETRDNNWTKCDIDDWFGWLEKYYWTSSSPTLLKSKKSTKPYVFSCYRRYSKDIKRSYYMHRMIMGIVDKSLMIDHINRDQLDNRRKNLRYDYNGDNSKNRNSQKDNKTGYKGVSKYGYKATISDGVKSLHLGYYEDPIDAAMAYDIASLKYHGDWGVLNFPELKEQYIKGITLKSIIQRGKKSQTNLSN